MGVSEQARKAIENQYQGICNIYEKKSVTDPVTKLETSDWVVANDIPIPCRLSFKAINTVGSQEGAPIKEQQIKLFLAPELQINPGSKIEVTQNGITETYKKSGVPAVYQTHQEVLLEKVGEWA